MSAPRVSVCVVSWNRAAYLAEALASVFAQSFEDFEVVVCDDASTDGTEALLRSSGDPRLRWIRQPRRMGIAANRNACVKAARGELVAWLDSDDRWLPGLLEAQVAVLDREPGVGLVHSGFRVIDEAGRRLPDWPALFAVDTIEPGGQAFGELVLSNYVNGSTVVIRRECYARVGGYAEELSRSGEDWELWLRVALRHDLAYTAGPLAEWRWHPGQSSVATTGSGERLRLDARVLRRVFREAPAGFEQRAWAALAFRYLLRSGDAYALGCRREALVAALQAARRFPPLRRRLPGLLAAIVRRDDYAHFRQTAAGLRPLRDELAGTRFGERVPVAEQELFVRRVREVVGGCVPPGARVIVVSRGDEQLLELDGRVGWHFPQDEAGGYAGFYPADSEAAVTALEGLRARGGEYLLVPSTAAWWLEHYPGLREHLEATARLVQAGEPCRIFELSGAR